MHNEKPHCLYTELNVVRVIRPKKDDIFGEYMEDNNIMNIK